MKYAAAAALATVAERLREFETVDGASTMEFAAEDMQSDAKTSLARPVDRGRLGRGRSLDGGRGDGADIQAGIDVTAWIGTTPCGPGDNARKLVEQLRALGRADAVEDGVERGLTLAGAFRRRPDPGGAENGTPGRFWRPSLRMG